MTSKEITFHDRTGHACSLLSLDAGGEPTIVLSVEDADGVTWLDRENVEGLVRFLCYWLQTGKLHIDRVPKERARVHKIIATVRGTDEEQHELRQRALDQRVNSLNNYCRGRLGLPLIGVAENDSTPPLARVVKQAVQAAQGQHTD